jgi:N6-L-threonylcarbamoyladenine synthase
MPKPIYILAIESSCDDTGAAVLENEKVLSNIVATQTVHELYGGVVPELASRNHQQNIIPTVDAALKKANINKSQLHAIAYTQGPGLSGSLLVGASFAKSLSLGLNIPLIGVHHMQAHILSHFIKNNEQDKIPEFPFLCLTVSGGHTQIVLLKNHFEQEIIGETLDDAAGEAFDKSAKMLGLPYPGGPLIDKYAKLGNPNVYAFAIPQIQDFNYSFSGLKTGILYFLQKEVAKDADFITKNLNDICASIQATIVKILLLKLKKAIDTTKVKHIALAGGVSANSGLRAAFEDLAQTKNVSSHIPPFEYCTDNAAMIGITGYLKYLNKDFSNISENIFSR